MFNHDDIAQLARDHHSELLRETKMSRQVKAATAASGGNKLLFLARIGDWLIGLGQTLKTKAGQLQTDSMPVQTVTVAEC
jgi:hypothetical protein